MKFGLVSLLLITLALAGCNKKTGSAATALTYFFDDFNRADETLSASTDWVTELNGSTFTVSNQMAHPGGGSSYQSAFYSQEYDSDDFSVSTTIKASGGNISSPVLYVVARFNTTQVATATEGYYCGLQTGTLTLYRYNTAVATGSAFTLNDGYEYSLALTQEGTLLTCSITGTHGTQSITYTDSAPFTGKYYGFATNTSGGYLYFDDFLVTGDL